MAGPKWLGEDVFVFQATLTEGSTKVDARVMMQSALEDRFDLKYRLEDRSLDIYQMVVGPTGEHLSPADPPDRQKNLTVSGAPASSVTSSSGKFSAVAMRLDDLGPWVERIAPLDRPVLNGTGLDGRYKIDLTWDSNDAASSVSASQSGGIVDALKRQVGLVLQKRNVLMEILVIDSVNRTPTPN